MLWRENPVKIGSNCTFVYFLWKKKVGTSCSSISTFGHPLFHLKSSVPYLFGRHRHAHELVLPFAPNISKMIIFFFFFSRFFGGNYKKKKNIFPPEKKKKISGGGFPPPPPHKPPG